MAQYNQVNIDSLKVAINNILNDLKALQIRNILNDLSSEDWNTQSKQKFVEALNKEDTNITNLEKKLNDYLQIAYYMSLWKTLYDKNTVNKKNRDYAYDRMYEWKKNQYGYYIYDRYGNRIPVEGTYNYYWGNQYYNYVTYINNNNNGMASYEEKIKNLI